MTASHNDVIIDDEKRGLIETASIESQDLIYLESLFDNLSNDKRLRFLNFVSSVF